MMPRAALETVGPLDDRYFLYFEETDWCWRARQQGLDVWYCAETEITHLEGRAAAQAGGFAQRQFQKSYRLFVAKNYGTRAGVGLPPGPVRRIRPEGPAAAAGCRASATGRWRPRIGRAPPSSGCGEIEATPPRRSGAASISHTCGGKRSQSDRRQSGNEPTRDTFADGKTVAPHKCGAPVFTDLEMASRRAGAGPPSTSGRDRASPLPRCEPGRGQREGAGHSAGAKPRGPSGSSAVTPRLPALPRLPLELRDQVLPRSQARRCGSPPRAARVVQHVQLQVEGAAQLAELLRAFLQQVAGPAPGWPGSAGASPR